MTTKNTIKNWFIEAKEENCYDYMIIVCDTYDLTDYPVYCNEDNFQEEYESHNRKNMQRVMEVYNLKLDMQKQLNEIRCFNYPENFKK